MIDFKGKIKLNWIIFFKIITINLFAQIEPGATRLNEYLPLIQNRNVAVVANQTSVLKSTHLVDTLLSLKINVKTVFAPEHGFRGVYSAGEIIEDKIDLKTGIPIVSLYGNNKKPTKNQLEEIDIVLFDIQDVGVRFYTFISTLHYVMESCAENNIPLIVLDRENPNRHYIDGPVLEKEYISFVGLHPVPVVYGMTIGEYALMINGEKWIKSPTECDLVIIPLLGDYTENNIIELPINPSPNLTSSISVNLYPSLCFFEGTNVSVGRGTDFPFEVYGAPYFDTFNFSFKPTPNQGAKNPKHIGKVCFGYNLKEYPFQEELNLNFLIQAYKHWLKKTENIEIKKENFFNSFFNKLAGNSMLQEQIKSGITDSEIKTSWERDLNEFKKIRKKYLLYISN